MIISPRGDGTYYGKAEYLGAVITAEAKTFKGALAAIYEQMEERAALYFPKQWSNSHVTH